MQDALFNFQLSVRDLAFTYRINIEFELHPLLGRRF